MTMSDQESAIVENSSSPDYTAIPIPSKNPAEYSYVERRAELLQQVRDLGHPSMIHQGEAAERYGVSQQQISKDLDRLAEHIEASLGDRRDLVTEAVFDRAIRGLLAEGEYRKAVTSVKDWNEWLDQRKDLRELEARLDRLEGI